MKMVNIILIPQKKIEAGFSYGSLSAAAKVVLVDDSGNRLPGINFDVYANNRDQYASVPDGQFKSSLEFFKTKGNFYVSSTVAFNQLTPENQKFFDEDINPQTKEQIASVLRQNNGKEAVAALDRKLGELRIEEDNRRKNPPLASVRVHGGGGSGTIIGVDEKDGKPIILTAGHLGGATRAGYRYSNNIDLADGRSVSGTSLGGYSDYGGSGNDYALIKLDQPIDKVPYVPVAGESHVVNKGDPALRIGCPSCGPFKQTQTRVGSVGNIIRHGTNEQIIGGESGGGLFHQGRLIGVVSTTGYYTGTAPIRNFLRQQGYGYLIKIMIILYR